MIPCKFQVNRGSGPTRVQFEVPEVKFPWRTSPGLREAPEVAGGGVDHPGKRRRSAVGEKDRISDTGQQGGTVEKSGTIAASAGAAPSSGWINMKTNDMGQHQSRSSDNWPFRLLLDDPLLPPPATERIVIEDSEEKGDASGDALASAPVGRDASLPPASSLALAKAALHPGALPAEPPEAEATLQDTLEDTQDDLQD